jgi:hypothetical protein
MCPFALFHGNSLNYPHFGILCQRNLATLDWGPTLRASSLLLLAAVEIYSKTRDWISASLATKKNYT